MNACCNKGRQVSSFWGGSSKFATFYWKLFSPAVLLLSPVVSVVIFIYFESVSACRALITFSRVVALTRHSGCFSKLSSALVIGHRSIDLSFVRPAGRPVGWVYELERQTVWCAKWLIWCLCHNRSFHSIHPAYSASLYRSYKKKHLLFCTQQQQRVYFVVHKSFCSKLKAQTSSPVTVPHVTVSVSVVVWLRQL